MALYIYGDFAVRYCCLRDCYGSLISFHIFAPLTYDVIYISRNSVIYCIEDERARVTSSTYSWCPRCRRCRRWHRRHSAHIQQNKSKNKDGSGEKGI